jgi:hypothetical protein
VWKSICTVRKYKELLSKIGAGKDGDKKKLSTIWKNAILFLWLSTGCPHTIHGEMLDNKRKNHSVKPSANPA